MINLEYISLPFYLWLATREKTEQVKKWRFFVFSLPAEILRSAEITTTIRSLNLKGLESNVTCEIYIFSERTLRKTQLLVNVKIYDEKQCWKLQEIFLETKRRNKKFKHSK